MKGENTMKKHICSVNVIFDLDAVHVDKETLSRKGRKAFVLDVQQKISDDLKQTYNEIWFLKSQCSFDTILGFENPEEMKKRAMEWNNIIHEKAALNMEYLEAEAKKAGKESVSDFLRSYKGDDISYRVWMLDMALAGVNIFQRYACEYYFIKSSVNNGCYETWLSDKVRKDIEEQPEKYVWTEIFLDSSGESNLPRDSRGWDY